MMYIPLLKHSDKHTHTNVDNIYFTIRCVERTEKYYIA